MKTIWPVLTIVSVLVLAGAAGTVVFLNSGSDTYDAASADAQSETGAGADLARFAGGYAGDGEHSEHGNGMERPAFPEAQGTTPTAQDAKGLEEVSSLFIESDEDFTPANGVRSGNGTLEDPYLITGYYVTGDLYIADTDACFVVMENWIGGQLTLNWNGQCTHVHHNHIDDLRVNENVRRTGLATGGLLELNDIDFIGQLRHYDGEFRDNVVGPYTQDDIFDPILETVPWVFATDPRVANIDGFNQGLIHHNTFYGSVDLDLHGHHHGTGFFASHSHYHGSDMDRKMPHDHTQRWTSVAFTDNLIIDPEGYGLRYEDQNHAGDDRTANSEDEDSLEEDHRHFTHIVLARNEIESGQLWVDVFNADDSNHHDRNPGWLDILDNTVRYAPRDSSSLLGLFGPDTDWSSAVHINTAKEVELTVTGNTIELLPAQQEDHGVLDPLYTPVLGSYEEPMAGIRLDGVKDSVLTLAENTILGFDYGIQAEDFSEDVQWTVSGNDFGDADYPVYYDDSVQSQPSGDDI